MIISLEEEILNKKFNKSYLIYKKNVPRLFPRLYSWKNNDWWWESRPGEELWGRMTDAMLTSAQVQTWPPKGKGKPAAEQPKGEQKGQPKGSSDIRAPLDNPADIVQSSLEDAKELERLKEENSKLKAQANQDYQHKKGKTKKRKEGGRVAATPPCQDRVGPSRTNSAHE